MTLRSPDCGISPPSTSPPLSPLAPVHFTPAAAAAVVVAPPFVDGGLVDFALVLLLPQAAATKVSATETITSVRGFLRWAMLCPSATEMRSEHSPATAWRGG